MTELAAARAPLQGVRVVDLTRLLPGNYATLVLYGLGAEVVKVEELTGDGTRIAPPLLPDGESGANVVLNRGKKSIAVNLKDPEGRRAVLALIASADALLDSFRPGVMERLGLGQDDLAAANPDLVHVSLTAFGAHSASVQLPAHDLNVEALSGLLSLSVDADEQPSMPAVPVADLATGLQAALAVMSGLLARTVSQAESGAGRSAPAPRGYRAQVSMADAALSLTTLAAGHVAAGLGSEPAGRDMLTGALACYRTYRCRDGWLAVGALEPKFFGRLCELIDRPAWAARQYDLGDQQSLAHDLQDVFDQRTRDEWSHLLSSEDTCVSPVLSVPEAFAAAEADRDVLVEASLQSGRSAPVCRAVPWLPEAPGARAARLGSDGADLLAQVGYDPQSVAELQAQGAVGGSL